MVNSAPGIKSGWRSTRPGTRAKRSDGTDTGNAPTRPSAMQAAVGGGPFFREYDAGSFQSTLLKRCRRRMKLHILRDGEIPFRCFGGGEQGAGGEGDWN